MDQNFTVLIEPLSKEEVSKQMKETGAVKGVVAVSLDFIINKDRDTFIDTLGEKLIGSCLLMDVEYRVVGGYNDYEVLIEVTGDGSPVLDEE